MTTTSTEPRRPMNVSQDMVWIPGGEFTMGSDHFYPEEAPQHRVAVDGFWIDRFQVTNRDFRKFVRETGYVTVAEQVPDAEMYPGALPELLVAGSVVFTPPPNRVSLDNHYNWWQWVPGADWQHPDGPESDLQGRDRHPVVHVAWDDVSAYAAWAGKSLPHEAEWEFAARGGHDGWDFAWGSELAPGGRMLANYWQGEFPIQNLKLDGYERTAPVGSFPANDYTLFDMIGNVWEWTTDWYTGTHTANTCCSVVERNPVGGDETASVDRSAAGNQIPRKVLKGGSFACADNYCRRYRPAARQHHPIDTGTNHVGFRCIVRPG